MLSTIIAVVIYPLIVLKSFAYKYVDCEFEKEFFSKRQTTVVKGIMIMIVYFHHFALMISGTDIINTVYSPAQISLAFFMFLAGYTTALGHLKSERINIKNIWKKRAWRLYLPITIFTIASNNFLDALIIFMVLTDIAFIKIKNANKRIAFVSLGSILYVMFHVVIGSAPYWYDDILPFAVGVAFAIYKDKIIRFLQAKIHYIVLLCCMILLGGFFLWESRLTVLYAISVTVFTFCFCIVIILIMMKLNPKSKLFVFLGQYSWEIYLFHQAFIFLFNKVFSRNVLIMISSFALTVIVGVLLQKAIYVFRNKNTKDYKKVA